MILDGATFKVHVFGWHCQHLARGLAFNGIRLGRTRPEVDRVIAEAFVFLFEGKGCRVIEVKGHHT